ncbi:aspartate aminotransferase family protein [Streptomyces asiaticus]|uniref:aspartate aminotransferase family protein n=1 Tax=Streptomyces asiaticus TaxID=114695 RepID=UPI003D717A7B
MEKNVMRELSNSTQLSSAIEAAMDRYIRENPDSARRHARALKVMPGGNTRSVLHVDPFPIAFERGEGPYLWSVDGVRYTDFLGEFTAGLYGHSDPVILDAIRAALDRGLNYGGPNAFEHELAELMCEKFPSMELVRFTNSGTEANLMALALALNYTGRKKVLVFKGGYHGGVLAFGDGQPSPVTVPHQFLLGDYNDTEGTRELIGSNEDDLAAILIEPMLGSGGCIPAEHEFLEMLRQEATRVDAVLIFDEVMTSRLGPSGVQGLENITPDLTTLGKYLAGGMSFGAFGGTQDLMAAYDPTRSISLIHSGTFNNNVLSMSAGIASLRATLSSDAVEQLNARGDRLRSALNAVAERRDVPLHVSGRGSVMTIHPSRRCLNASEGLSTVQSLLRDILFFGLVSGKKWLARRGMIALSLPITDAHCHDLVAEFDNVVERNASLFHSSGESV